MSRVFHTRQFDIIYDVLMSRVFHTRQFDIIYDVLMSRVFHTRQFDIIYDVLRLLQYLICCNVFQGQTLYAMLLHLF